MYTNRLWTGGRTAAGALTHNQQQILLRWQFRFPGSRQFAKDSPAAARTLATPLTVTAHFWIHQSSVLPCVSCFFVHAAGEIITDNWMPVKAGTDSKQLSGAIAARIRQSGHTVLECYGSAAVTKAVQVCCMFLGARLGQC
jgi:hypothetical protein